MKGRTFCLRPAILLKERLCLRVFSCEYCKIFKNTSGVRKSFKNCNAMASEIRFFLTYLLSWRSCKSLNWRHQHKFRKKLRRSSLISYYSNASATQRVLLVGDIESNPGPTSTANSRSTPEDQHRTIIKPVKRQQRN